MEIEMQEMCLECLQRCIQRDFSDRVLVSYGLFDSARPCGSRVVCEVDLTGRADNLARKEETAELVVQLVAENAKGCLRQFIGDRISQQMTAEAVGEKLSGPTQNQEQNEGEGFELEKQEAKFFKANSNCCSKSSEGTLDVFTMNNNKSLNNLTGKYFTGYLKGNGKFKLFSLEDIARLSPSANVGNASYDALESLLWNLNSGLTEETIMSSVNLFLEEKSRDRCALEFINSLGTPLSSEEKAPTPCIRHPNIVPILGIFRNSGYMHIVLPKAPYTLENILHFSPRALKSDWHTRFLTYQIISALAYSHKLGIAHGSLNPSNVLLTDTYWCWLIGFGEHWEKNMGEDLGKETSSGVFLSQVDFCTQTCPCRTLFAELKLSSLLDWQSDFKGWWEGNLSNYEYLLTLNRLAGRRWGDRTFHTVMPWVIDFSVKPDENSEVGWRDLKKSKWHLAKGDEQLDFTYASSEIPHHVSDECLSELAVCSYKARRLPLSVLRRTVRSVYEPNEYPANMQRLYQWTPDECIPEFYYDPRVFFSIHEGMSDLAVPSWAATPEEFISLHRAALESDRVSMELHHWIDLTFGYKLCGEAAVVAKNVTLSTSSPTVLRSVGRRQLFTRPHPKRKATLKGMQNEWQDPIEVGSQVLKPSNGIKSKMNDRGVVQPENLLSDSTHCFGMNKCSMSVLLEELEELTLFCESTRHLSPCYRPSFTFLSNNMNLQSLLEVQPTNPIVKTMPNGTSDPCYGDSNKFLDCLEDNEDGRGRNFQDFVLWQKKSLFHGSPTESLADDIFAVGCILAELHLHRPLFDPISLEAYTNDGILPGSIKKLPPYLQCFIESTLQQDWTRRPSAKTLLESPYFPSTVRSAYLFLAPLHLLASKRARLQYAARLARQGALHLMGSFAAEMCFPSCLPLIMTPTSDFDVEAAVHLLKEFLQSLKVQAAKTLLVPVIQKILQSAETSHLKIAVLQNSFIRDLWKTLGKQIYFERIHPLVISNLYMSSDKNSAAASLVLLVGCCEDLGVPITIHQTIVPLMQCFGRGIALDGIETLVRIGGHLGEKTIVRQMLPPLRSIILFGMDFANMDKPEPFQSWHTLSLIDALAVLNGLVTILPSSVVLTELVQEQNLVLVKLLMQPNLSPNLLQNAANTLLAICQHIGPDSTTMYVLPQLKQLLDEIAFSQKGDTLLVEPGKQNSSSRSLGLHIDRNIELDKDTCNDSRIDLVFMLYPSLASLLGIERLRQCFTTWLLLEQILNRRYKWKWKHIGEASQSGMENVHGAGVSKSPPADFNPANLLLNGVGWSIPQSQASKISKTSVSSKQIPDNIPNAKNGTLVASVKSEPWFWLPSAADSWEGPEFLGRISGMKDEHPWRLKASVLHSVRAHSGALRALAVADDECTVFSAGVGPRARGIVCKWRLSTMDCLLGYVGHEEVVNDICILPGYERVASCDGTVHIWNSQTGKRISMFSEPSESSSVGAILPAISGEANELGSGVNTTTLSGGILSAGFHGSLYTCIHCMEAEEMLVSGTGNGYLRFIDINVGQKLHLWQCEPLESSYSSLVSAICCSGHQEKLEGRKSLSISSWIAAGFSSGQCRLLDLKSGSIIAQWRAHDGFVTKLATLEEHLLVSSSLDRTLRLWDLRRGCPAQVQVFRGHLDGVSSFSIWGCDMLSASGSKIGLSSVSKSYDQQQQPQLISPQKLYSADRGMKNLSAISTINVLPFSRLFLVGTEDGYVKICC